MSSVGSVTEAGMCFCEEGSQNTQGDECVGRPARGSRLTLRAMKQGLGTVKEAKAHKGLARCFSSGFGILEKPLNFK